MIIPQHEYAGLNVWKNFYLPDFQNFLFLKQITYD